MPAQKKRKKEALRELAEKIERRTEPLRLTGLRGSSRALMAAELIRAHPDQPALILAPSAKRCDALVEDLRSTLGSEISAERLCAFPRHDTLPYDRFSPQPFLITARTHVLYRWLECSSPKRSPSPPPPSSWPIGPLSQTGCPLAKVLIDMCTDFRLARLSIVKAGSRRFMKPAISECL